MAFVFQLFNAVSIGGYLGGYGPTTQSGWYSDSSEGGTRGHIFIGLLLWAFGFSLSVWHDEELRELRRAVMRKQRVRDENSKTTENENGPDKIYIIPENGMFRFILYPHYLFEWVEWTGFWVMAGTGCVPAKNFVVNEISTMLPRALQGKRWYVEKFGEEKVRGRKAIIPGLL
jgi:3-oxo-5-alpha-steroid 4-dehydrogenase 1